jgi:putative ABC transport system permease protein
MHLRGSPRRFRFPWRTAAQIRRDVDDELAFHLNEKITALREKGLSEEEAKEKALRQFGDLDEARAQLIAEGRRGAIALRWQCALEDLVRDLRFAWRSLWHTPTFTGIASEAAAEPGSP